MNNNYTLQCVLKTNPYIIGMGNPLRGDDAVGINIAEALIKKMGNFYNAILNAEDIIEGHIFTLVNKPEKNFIIIDAVEYPAPKGTILFTLYDDNTEEEGGLSTHKLSLSLSVKILKAHNKNVFLLGIVTNTIEFGSNMSKEVKQSETDVINTISMILSENRKEKLYA